MSLSLLFCSSRRAFIDLISSSLFSEFLPLKIFVIGSILGVCRGSYVFLRLFVCGENSLPGPELIPSRLSASSAKFYLSHRLAPLVSLTFSGEKRLLSNVRLELPTY